MSKLIACMYVVCGLSFYPHSKAFDLYSLWLASMKSYYRQELQRMLITYKTVSHKDILCKCFIQVFVYDLTG